MNWFEELLRRKIGLDVAAVGSSLIQRAIRLRMKALGLATTDAYRDCLSASEPELEALIEGVVVAETWFFRDHDPFRAFIQLVQPPLSLESRGSSLNSGIPDSRLQTPNLCEPVRILSVPCSTGEEPYSLAMALLDASVPRPRFHIDAVDLSARALERAQQAEYGKNSFRGQSLQFRDRYFSPIAAGWKLHRQVQDCVQFHRGNLLEPDFFADRAPFDFIFCRNLLIYFDRVTQTRALRKLDRLLAPDGVLFVGPAELPLVSDRGFVSAGLPMAFACRKARAAKQNGAARRVAPCRPAPAPAHRPTSKVPSLDSGFQALDSAHDPLAVGPHRPARTPDLNAAHALADAGKLSEAAALCEAHLKSQGPSAQAYYLLGLVTEARENEAGHNMKPKTTTTNSRNPVSELLSSGSPTARPVTASRVLQPSRFARALDFYRKALYLDPNHHETLLQLSLLLEKLGDASGAKSFRRRAATGETRLRAKG